MTKSIKQWAADVHQNSRDHGWYEGVEPGDTKLIPEKLMLVVSEVSEALEVYREGVNPSLSYLTAVRRADGSIVSKPVGFDSELADAAIRIFDLAEHLGIDIERAIEEKHEFNKTRPHRHGGKVC